MIRTIIRTRRRPAHEPQMKVIFVGDVGFKLVRGDFIHVRDGSGGPAFETVHSISYDLPTNTQLVVIDNVDTDNFYGPSLELSGT